MGRLDEIARWAVTCVRGQAKENSASHPEAVTFLASGFWVRLREGHEGLCTTKHNVDPSLKRRDLRLTELELEVRHHDGRTTTFHRVRNLGAALWSHGSADCAIVVNPQLENSPLNPNRFAVSEEWIATHAHFDWLQIADEAFFIGFPGFDGRMWFDEGAVLPIARAASLASIPSVPFTNNQIRTDDVLMVAGLLMS